MNWSKLTNWQHHGKGFYIEIMHWTVPVKTGSDVGPNRWGVYAFIYPDHPHFKAFSGDSCSQNAVSVLPLHTGWKGLHYFYGKDGEILKIQVGVDYSQFSEERHSYNDAGNDTQYLTDAEALFDWFWLREGRDE